MAQSYPTLWPHGLQYARLPFLHHLPELAQTHLHWVGDVIQPSCPLLPPSLPALNLYQHQGLFQWVGSDVLWCIILTGGLWNQKNLISYMRYVIYMSLYCTPDLVLGSWRIYVNMGMMDVWVEAWRQMCVQRGDTYRYKYGVEDTHTVQIHGILCGLIGAHVCKVLCTHMYYAWGYIGSSM